METSELTYKKFEHNKSINELEYDTLIWISGFEFIKTELAFLKKLIQSNSFKSRIPNLYERLQLFIQEIDLLQKNNQRILHKLTEQHNNLSGKLYYESFQLIAYEKLAEKIFNYTITYQNFKIRIFEYLESILKQE